MSEEFSKLENTDKGEEQSQEQAAVANFDYLDSMKELLQEFKSDNQARPGLDDQINSAKSLPDLVLELKAKAALKAAKAEGEDKDKEDGCEKKEKRGERKKEGAEGKESASKVDIENRKIELEKHMQDSREKAEEKRDGKPKNEPAHDLDKSKSLESESKLQDLKENVEKAAQTLILGKLIGSIASGNAEAMQSTLDRIAERPDAEELLKAFQRKLDNDKTDVSYEIGTDEHGNKTARLDLVVRETAGQDYPRTSLSIGCSNCANKAEAWQENSPENKEPVDPSKALAKIWNSNSRQKTILGRDEGNSLIDASRPDRRIPNHSYYPSLKS